FYAPSAPLLEFIVRSNGACERTTGLKNTRTMEAKNHWIQSIRGIDELMELHQTVAEPDALLSRNAQLILCGVPMTGPMTVSYGPDSAFVATHSLR
ncbi:hypothetical protein, partial [Amylibacter marinus]|uniref:hypothetical protein n=1 Tax=Amylibacter marinus TaxID=1475483 RepID=UPI0024E0A133